MFGFYVCFWLSFSPASFPELNLVKQVLESPIIVRKKIKLEEIKQRLKILRGRTTVENSS